LREKERENSITIYCALKKPPGKQKNQVSSMIGEYFSETLYLLVCLLVLLVSWKRTYVYIKMWSNVEDDAPETQIYPQLRIDYQL